MVHVGDAGVVDQRHQGVQGPRVYLRYLELETVGEEDSDNLPGEFFGDAWYVIG